MPNRRGWKWNQNDTELEAYSNGTKVITLDGSSGLVVEVNGLDLAGQTITSTAGAGATDLSTMIGAYSSGDGSANEGPKYCVVIKVGGTAYYVPAFLTI